MKTPLLFTSKKATLLSAGLKFSLLAALILAQSQVILAQKKPVKKVLKAVNDATMPALYISPQGNVGIGTNNPENKLQLGGDMHVNGNAIFFRSGAGDKYDFIKWNWPLPEFPLHQDDKLDMGGYRGVRIGDMVAGVGFFPVLTIGRTRSFNNEDRITPAVDIKRDARAGDAPALPLALYVTGKMDGTGEGVEFRNTDGNEGLGFFKNTMYQTGRDRNINFRVDGLGNITFRTNGVERMFINSEGSSAFMGNLSVDGETRMKKKLWMYGNSIFFKTNEGDESDYIGWKPQVPNDVTSDRVVIAGWQGVELGSTRDYAGKTRTTLTVANTGFVGIGATNPQFPLEVKGIRGGGLYRYQENVADSWEWGWGTRGFRTGDRGYNTCSIKADADVVTNSAFVSTQSTAFSDIRLKKDVSPSSSVDDLEKLKAIKVVNYKMIDTIAYNRPYKKVIAQQVQQVYPLAIGTSFRTLPDVFQHAITVTKQADSLYLLSVAKPAKLKVGDILELKCSEAGDANVMVTAVKGQTEFVVSSKLAIDKQKDVFVYGHPASDVLTVDYEAIGMLNVSATQQLSKTIDEQQKEIAFLKKQNAELLQAVSQVMARLQKVEDAKPQSTTIAQNPVNK